jgi:protein-tyrosine phosphatase
VEEQKMRQTFPVTYDETDAEAARFRICFVCTGNICRSPMAETVFRRIARDAGHEASVIVSSAGTGDWHVGERADPRTLGALTHRGYDGSAHRAKQFEPEGFADLDLVIALDRTHERVLNAWAPTEQERAKVHLLTSFDRELGAVDIADPYYSDDARFDETLAAIERACRALFDQIRPALRQGAA